MTEQKEEEGCKGCKQKSGEFAARVRHGVESGGYVPPEVIKEEIQKLSKTKDIIIGESIIEE